MINNLQTQQIPLYTNKMDVKINRENVDKDFKIFQIGTKNPCYKTNVLDIASTELKAYSVAYYQNNRWFALFLKDQVEKSKFADLVQANDSSATINEVDLFSTDYNSKYAIKDVELAQLIANTLMNNKIFGYNNITGSLYYKPEKNLNANSVDFLKLRFFTSLPKNNFHLEADFVTFTKCNSIKMLMPKEKKYYLFDKTSGAFRKALDSDFEFSKENQNNKCSFYYKGVDEKKGKKKHQFVNFNSKEQFDNSKSGLIAKFLNDVNSTLSIYMTIKQSPIFEYKAFDDKVNLRYNEPDYKKYLKEKGRGFSVVDTVNTTVSNELQKRIIEILKSEYDISNIQTKRKKNNYIFEIIHLNYPKALQDQHNSYTEEDIIQHVTIENFDLINPLTETDEKKQKAIIKTNSDKMKNLIQELIIKGDIYDRHISIVDWSESKEWNFACCGTGKWNESKNRNEFTYYKANIKTDGTITLLNCNSTKIPNDKEWEVIDEIFKKYNKNEHNQHNRVECIIYNDISKVNVIYKSKKFTLPNLEKITNDLILTDENVEHPKTKIRNLLSSFEKEQNKISEPLKKQIEIIKKNLENESSENISIGKLRDGVESKSIKKLIVYFEEHGVKIHARPKANDNIFKNFNSLIGLKITKIDESYKYFVGKKKEDLKYSLPCSCIIRDVIPWTNGEEDNSGEIFLDEFAHMMTVKFVRNGQWTVLPFPIKYLREYQKFNEKDDIFDE